MLFNIKDILDESLDVGIPAKDENIDLGFCSPNEDILKYGNRDVSLSSLVFCCPKDNEAEWWTTTRTYLPHCNQWNVLK